MSEHRDKAVADGVRAYRRNSSRPPTRQGVEAAIKAAEPHLERMYFERFVSGKVKRYSPTVSEAFEDIPELPCMA